jgi:hypothetical protein
MENQLSFDLYSGICGRLMLTIQIYIPGDGEEV